MWALVDCDNFFCSCERVFRPDLVGRPVVVLSNNDGCVVARSAEVKKMGIKMGMPYYQLLEQYPQSGIVAFSSNYALYGDMSNRVMRILRDSAPALLQYSIDEGFLQLNGMDRAVDLKRWGEELAARIQRWTGIPVCIGIGHTKTLAKVATRFAKRYPAYRRCCIIASDEQRVKALGLFDAADVWGIGRRIARSLATYGLNTALDFARRPKEWVKAKYHVTGLRTWAELNGINAIDIDDMYKVTKKTIMTSRSLPDMISDLGDLHSHVANHAARCAAKLRKQDCACSAVTVFIASNYFREDLPQYTGSATATFATATSATGQIVETAARVLDAIYRPGIRYKRAGVMVSEIVPADCVQLDLFSYNPVLGQKYKAVSEAIDEINSRLGADTVMMAAQQYSQKDETGKSIKFVQAIRRALKSPDYSIRLDQFKLK